MEEILSNFIHAGPIHQFWLSNSSRAIILFLYVTYYERVMNKILIETVVWRQKRLDEGAA